MAGDPRFCSIVITGASSGIGLALATHYARRGAVLLLVGRDPTRLEAAAAQCRASGATVETAAIDVCDAPALGSRLLSFDAVSPVDLVIANAGITGSLGPGRSAEPLAEAVAQLRINLEGAINTVTPLIAATLGNWLFRVPLAFFVSTVLRLDVIWLWCTLALDHLARALWLLWAFQRGRWADSDRAP